MVSPYKMATSTAAAKGLRQTPFGSECLNCLVSFDHIRFWIKLEDNPGLLPKGYPVSGSKETTRCVVRTIPSWNSKQPRNTGWSDSALQMFVNLVARSSGWAEAPESNTENLSQSVLNIFGSKINANSLCPTVIMKDQLAQPAGVSQSRQEQTCISLWGEKKKSL